MRHLRWAGPSRQGRVYAGAEQLHPLERLVAGRVVQPDVGRLLIALTGAAADGDERAVGQLHHVVVPARPGLRLGTTSLGASPAARIRRVDDPSEDAIASMVVSPGGGVRGAADDGHAKSSRRAVREQDA